MKIKKYLLIFILLIIFNGLLFSKLLRADSAVTHIFDNNPTQILFELLVVTYSKDVNSAAGLVEDEKSKSKLHALINDGKAKIKKQFRVTALNGHKNIFNDTQDNIIKETTFFGLF